LLNRKTPVKLSKRCYDEFTRTFLKTDFMEKGEGGTRQNNFKYFIAAKNRIIVKLQIANLVYASVFE